MQPFFQNISDISIMLEKFSKRFSMYQGVLLNLRIFQANFKKILKQDFFLILDYSTKFFSNFPESIRIFQEYSRDISRKFLKQNVLESSKKVQNVPNYSKNKKNIVASSRKFQKFSTIFQRNESFSNMLQNISQIEMFPNVLLSFEDFQSVPECFSINTFQTVQNVLKCPKILQDVQKCPK